ASSNETTTLSPRATGRMRNVSAASTKVPTLRSSAAHTSHDRTVIQRSVLIPHRNSHACSPERELLRCCRATHALVLTGQALKISNVPADPQPLRQESRDACANVERRQV